MKLASAVKISRLVVYMGVVVGLLPNQCILLFTAISTLNWRTSH